MPKARVKAQINQPLGGASAAVVSGGGAAGGAGTYPDTVSLATQNTVIGSKHVHKLDITSHTGNAAAHHALVTAGAGIGVVGQQVSVSLAAASGLNASAGLALDDSVAGNGLTIASKVLAVGVSGLGLSAGADAVALASSSNPGAAASILASDAFGGLTLEALTVHGAVQVDQGLTAAGNTFRVVHHTHDYPHSHVVVNPTAGWNLDEQFGVDIDDSLLVRGYIVGKHALQIPDAALILHFDGPEPYETNYTGNPTGHMGQVATVTGGSIYRPGKFGKAVQCAEATMNMIVNPSFETGTASWSHYSDGTGPTFERNALAAWIGSYGLRWVLGTSTTGTAYLLSSMSAPTQGVTYTASVWVKGIGTAVGKSFYLGLGEYGGASANAVTYSTQVTLTGEWQLFMVSRTVEQADRTSLGIVPRYYTGAIAGDEVYVDGAQIEAKAYPTPYCDGSLGAGHSWSGTAHASTSSRTLAGLTYANPLYGHQGAWSLSLWVIPASSHATLAAGTSRGLVNLNVATSPRRNDVWVAGASGTTTAWYDGYAWLYATIDPYVPYEARHLVFVWDGTQRHIYCDGVEVGSDTPTSAPTFDTTVRVGWHSTTYLFNGWLDDVVFVKRALDADEVRAIYESNAPVFAETSTWQWRAARNLVWADSEGLWAVDEAGDPTFAVSGVAKSWGGASLGAGDIFIGNVAQGHYLHWDDSAGTLVIRGDVVITGTPGAEWSTITGKPDGANHLGTGNNPGDPGLWLTASYLGYHAGSGVWPVYINSNGQFYFSKDTSNYVKYDGTTFEVKGRIVITEGTTVDTLPDGTTYGKVAKTILAGGYIQVGTGTKDSTLNGWNISGTEIVGQAAGVDQVVLGTTGVITAGAGGVTLNADGIRLKHTLAASAPDSGTAILFGTSTTIATISGYRNAGVTIQGIQFRLIAAGTGGGYNSLYYYIKDGTYAGTFDMSQANVITHDLTATSIASGYLGYTPGDGDIVANRYVRADQAFVVADGVTAPTALSGIAFIYVDSADGDLKVRFGDGVTKVLAADT